MDDMASVGLQVDSRDVRTASGDLDRFARSGDKASRSANQATGSFGGMARGASRMAAGLGLAVSAAAALASAFRGTQQYTVMTNSLRAIGMSGTEATAALEQIGDIAARTRAPLDATAQLYQRISIAGRDLGASSSDVLRFTENVGLALAQVGGGGAAASGALLQLSQAMSGGTVRAEEFNSILEGAFPIAQAAANAIEGAAGSVGQLRNMVIAGEISSREFFEAVLSQSAALEDAFANTIPTISGAMQVFRDQMTLSLGSLDSMVGGSESFARAILLMAENLDVVGATLGVAVTVFGVKYVGALALSTTATFTFVGALGILKTALIRTGIGALVVGAGYLVAMFGRLVKGAGGFGEALDLLKDVAAEVWDRVSLSADAAWTRVKAGWATAQAGIYDGLQDATAEVVGWANNTVNTFEGTFLAVKAIWGALPDVFERVGALATNGLLEVMETGIAGITEAINTVLTLGGRRPEWAIAAPDLSEWKSAVPEAVNLGERAREAYDSAFSDNPFQVPELFGGMADDARGRAAGYSEAAGMLSEAASRPLTSIAALRDAMAESETATERAAAEAEAMNAALEDIGGTGGGGTGGGSAGKAANAIEEATTLAGGSAGLWANAIEEATTFAGGFAEAIADGTKSAADMGRELGGSLLRGIGSVSDAFGDFVTRGFKDFKGFVSSILDSFKSMLSQMISMAVQNKILIPITTAFTGGGAGQALAAAGHWAAGGGEPLGGGGGILSGLLGSFGTGGGIAGLAGGAGFLGGVGNVLGGLASGGLSGGIGAIGSALGGATASLGGFAMAAGAVAVPLLAAAAVFSLFKKKTKELDSGLRVTVNGMDTLVQTFRKIETSQFWGLSKNVSTKYKNAGDEVADPLIKAVGEMQGGILDSAEALGISAAVFDGFAHTLKVSTKGLSDEAAQKAVMEAFTGLGDAFAGMIPGLQALQKDGEGAMAAIERLAQSLTAVNSRMADLGLNLYDVSLAGGGAAAAFVDLFGSLENFNAVSQSYYDNFYTDAERIARATELLSIEMAALGIDTLPATRAAFRALVDEADALGDSELVASLMQLSPAFAEITAGADELGDSLRALVNEDLFATGQDYARALSRSSNSQTFTPQQSDAELRAEMRALNVSMERLVSSSEITAGNTGRGADAADDTLAIQLEQTL